MRSAIPPGSACAPPPQPSTPPGPPSSGLPVASTTRGPFFRHSRANLSAATRTPRAPDDRRAADPSSPPSPAPRGRPTRLSAAQSRPARKMHLPAATRTPRESASSPCRTSARSAPSAMKPCRPPQAAHPTGTPARPTRRATAKCDPTPNVPRRLAPATRRRYIARLGRSVAQPGRALCSGRRGRRFESSHSDQQPKPPAATPPPGDQPARGMWPTAPKSAIRTASQATPQQRAHREAPR
jgi:hypothetical protein